MGKVSSSFRTLPGDIDSGQAIERDRERERLRDSDRDIITFTGGQARINECIFSVSQLMQLIDS